MQSIDPSSEHALIPVSVEDTVIKSSHPMDLMWVILVYQKCSFSIFYDVMFLIDNAINQSSMF